MYVYIIYLFIIFKNALISWLWNLIVNPQTFIVRYLPGNKIWFLLFFIFFPPTGKFSFIF